MFTYLIDHINGQQPPSGTIDKNHVPLVNKATCPVRGLLGSPQPMRGPAWRGKNCRRTTVRVKLAARQMRLE